MLSTDSGAIRVADFLSKNLSVATGYSFHVKELSGKTSARDHILLQLSSDSTITNEGYKLEVTPGGITITARKAAGLFYGMQSLLQLLPAEIESKTIVKNTTWTIPAVVITDKSRFGWRGLLFDVTRHFLQSRK